MLKTLYRESLLHALLSTLCSLWQSSCLGALCTRVADWFEDEVRSSALLTALEREGRVARVWRESLLCRLLTFLLNLPGILLHKLYLAATGLFEGSFFARLAFEMGESTAIAQSWLIMLLWIIPFSHWNNAYTMMGFFLLLLLIYAGSMHRTDCRLDLGSVGFYPMVFFLAVIGSTFWSCLPGESIHFLLYHASAALCVLVTVSAVRSSRDLIRLVTGAGFAVFVTSAYGVVQRIQGVEVNKSFVDVKVNPDMPGRVMSIFDNPNTFAEVLILLLPLVLAMVIAAKRPWSRITFAGVFLVGVAALGMTYSRASWVGFAFSLAVLVLLWRPRLIPLCILLALAAIPLLPTSILNRILTITNPNDTSTASRFPLYEAALSTIRTAPLTGAGLGTHAVQAFIKEHNLYHGVAPYVHAHNFYLEVWVETGVIGVLGFLGSLLWGLKRGLHAARHCGPSAARTITCAAAAAMCGAMVCGMADYFWNYPRVLSIFWFTFAILLAGVKLCRQQMENEA